VSILALSLILKGILMAASPPISAKSWFARLAPYRKAKDGRAVFELLISLIPFFALWVCMAVLLTAGHWWALIGVIPASGFIVRLFIIQHDCGHGSMFSRKKLNDWVGRGISLLTLTPYDHWRRGHALHHAGSGNLDRRGIGDDILTLTVDEYQALSKFGRLKYRLFRHPLVMFGIGPFYLFVLAQRLPTREINRTMPWVSTMITNIGVFILYGLLIWTLGIKVFLLIQLPITIIASSIGVWMFYVQHQFEDTHWSRKPDWEREHAALHGSSYYALPAPLMWITGNIGIHHVHHLSSRIPFYNLPRILKAHPELKTVGCLTVWQSLKSVRLTLWCERTNRMISFAERKAVIA